MPLLAAGRGEAATTAKSPVRGSKVRPVVEPSPSPSVVAIAEKGEGVTPTEEGTSAAPIPAPPADVDAEAEKGAAAVTSVSASGTPGVRVEGGAEEAREASAAAAPPLVAGGPSALPVAVTLADGGAPVEIVAVAGAPATASVTSGVLRVSAVTLLGVAAVVV